MTTKITAALVCSAALLVFSSPSFATSGDPQSGQSSQNASQPVQGSNEAAQMVPARAALLHTLDAKKDQPGSAFQAKLAKAVRLQDGTMLPAGTTLIGTVATDDMQVNGMSKLALRFTAARLKDGKTIPIRATIVGLFAPKDESGSGYPITPGEQYPNTWTPKSLQVDQLGVASGVDLHSKIASNNSGVFVSRTRDDVKLNGGSEVALAIAASPAQAPGS